MAFKLVFLLDEKWRSLGFSHAVKCWSDGTISYPEELSGCTMVLATGVRPQKRPLLVLSDQPSSSETVTKKPVVRTKLAEQPNKRARGKILERVVKVTMIGLGIGSIIHGLVVLAAQ